MEVTHNLDRSIGARKCNIANSVSVDRWNKFTRSNIVESELGAQEGAWFGALVMPRNFGVELMDANLFSRVDPPNLALLVG